MRAEPTLERCRAIGAQITDEQWLSLPEPARRRLSRMPDATEADRHAIVDLVRWLVATFPPGWQRSA